MSHQEPAANPTANDRRRTTRSLVAHTVTLASVVLAIARARPRVERTGQRGRRPRARSSPSDRTDSRTPDPSRAGVVRVDEFTIRVTVAGRFGIPAAITAAAVTVTSTNVAADGFVTAYPAGTPVPLDIDVEPPRPLRSRQLGDRRRRRRRRDRRAEHAADRHRDRPDRRRHGRVRARQQLARREVRARSHPPASRIPERRAHRPPVSRPAPASAFRCRRAWRPMRRRSRSTSRPSVACGPGSSASARPAGIHDDVVHEPRRERAGPCRVGHRPRVARRLRHHHHRRWTRDRRSRRMVHRSVGVRLRPTGCSSPPHRPGSSTRGRDAPRLWPNGTRELAMSAFGAAAIATNVTIDRTDASGFVTAYPAGTPLPTASTINAFGVNDTVANFAITPISNRGSAYYSDRGHRPHRRRHRLLHRHADDGDAPGAAERAAAGTRPARR